MVGLKFYQCFDRYRTEPTHVKFVLITHTNSEGSGEHTNPRNSYRKSLCCSLTKHRALKDVSIRYSYCNKHIFWHNKLCNWGPNMLSSWNKVVIHVGLIETYRNKQTDKMFVWNYIGNWYVFCFFFLLNILIIIADINSVQTARCSEIFPLYFDLFFKIFCQKNRGDLLREKPTQYMLILNI